MATRQQMLDDVNLRYRNTFSTVQKLVWVNDYEKELFEMFQIDAPPYGFLTVTGQEFYPIPSGVDINKIKVVTIELSSGTFQEIPFKRNDDKQSASGYWYTIVSDLFFINLPCGILDNMHVYIYHDSKPTKWNMNNLLDEPSTPSKYQEILKLHLLEMIAGARKDVAMKNNFMMDKEKKIDDFMWQMTMNEPEFVTPAAVRSW